jgi:hypothetical protein
MTEATQQAAQPGRENEPRRRDIGPLGTGARVIVGLGILASVVHGHVVGELRLAPWLLGLVGFPALVLGGQWWRSRRTPARFDATGPVAQLLNIGVFVALYLTPDYAPALSVTSDAALLFYGASMLLAAGRGYSACEVLAVSNWLLRRDDQVGCLLFAPIDYLEGRASHYSRSSSQEGWSC